MKFFFTVTKKSLAWLLCLSIVIFFTSLWFSSLKAQAIDGSTHEKRMIYINSLKISVDEENAAKKETVIPSAFSDVYSNYNSLQKKSGFDLSKYKGKSVTIYSYPLISGDKNLTLIICEGKIIGGDIADISFNGEMKPLKEK